MHDKTLPRDSGPYLVLISINNLLQTDEKIQYPQASTRGLRFCFFMVLGYMIGLDQTPKRALSKDLSLNRFGQFGSENNILSEGC